MSEQPVSISAEDLPATSPQSAAWRDAVHRAEHGETVAVIAHGEHVADVVPSGELDRLRETIEVLSDHDLGRALGDRDAVVTGRDAITHLVTQRADRETVVTERFEVDLTRAARRSLAETLPLDVAIAVADFDLVRVVRQHPWPRRPGPRPSNATGKQQMGVGQARNRLPKAVERTVPFGMVIYQTKTEPSFEDMITKLRKTLIAARFTSVAPGQPDPDLLHDYALACAAAAA